MTGEDVEDQLRAVDDSRMNLALNIALLGRREIVIEENQVGGNRGRRAFDFFQLPFANQRGGIGLVAVLQEFTRDLGASTERERTQLRQRFLGREIRGANILGTRSETSRSIACSLSSRRERSFC